MAQLDPTGDQDNANIYKKCCHWTCETHPPLDKRNSGLEQLYSTYRALCRGEVLTLHQCRLKVLLPGVPSLSLCPPEVPPLPDLPPAALPGGGAEQGAPGQPPPPPPAPGTEVRPGLQLSQ